VFLKVYVDWARKPDEGTRSRLLPFLHVPLDSVLMKAVSDQYRPWYEKEIMPFGLRIQHEFSLSKIAAPVYLKWQQFFRQSYPPKPLIFDIAWALNRRK
jgi:hypothetical protein